MGFYLKSSRIQETLSPACKNTAVLFFHLCKCFPSFSSIFFQRVLIMDYNHTLPFIFIHKNINFPFLCFKKSSSNRSETVYRRKYTIFYPREYLASVPHNPCAETETHSALATTFRGCVYNINTTQQSQWRIHQV